MREKCLNEKLDARDGALMHSLAIVKMQLTAIISFFSLCTFRYSFVGHLFVQLSAQTSGQQMHMQLLCMPSEQNLSSEV